MRILTFKRVLGLAALGYGYQYAKKHGGVRNAWNELLGKARIAIDKGRESMREGVADTTSGMAGAGDIGDDARSTTGFSSGYTPGGGGGYGGNRGL